jgi:phage host-nuclease inhibitor protein Gam
MNFLKAAVVVVVVAVGSGAVMLERQSNAQLREEVALLRREVGDLRQRETRRSEASPTTATDAAAAAYENERAEIARLREELNALKAKAQEFGQVTQSLKTAVAAASAGKSATDALPVRLTPISEWKNAGKATPSAAVETVLWAAAGGDVDTIANSLELTPSAREKAQALFDRLPEATRAQYGSPEKLMALMMAKDADKVSGLQVLGSRELSQDNVGMRVRFGNDLGQTKEQSLLLHHASDGWRLMLTDDPVDKWAKQLGAGGGK